MQLFSQLDSIALERELLDRIDAAHPRATPGRTLVLVPTTRLAAHLQRRLAERRPAWLGLRVLDFSGLTRQILAQQPGDTPHVASDLLLEALLGRLAETHPRNPWIAFTRKRPGALRTLHETLKDLREAGVEPRVVAECCPEGGLAEIFEAYHNALEAAGPSGWTDRAGLVRRATGHAEHYAASFRAIFVHGAYEWTAVNLDLLREIDRGRELTVFVPSQPGTPVSRFAERFAEGHLAAAENGPGEAGPVAEAKRAALRLDALFDEESRPEPAAEGRLFFAHAQGTSAEVKLAVRDALRAVAAGCPPTEIVLTARSLAPYAAAFEEIFDDEGLAWTSSLATPLRRRPAVRDFLLFLKVVAEDYPRAATVSLLGSPLVDWSAMAGEDLPTPRADCADRWSREAGLVGGLDDWTHVLPRWAGKPKTHPGQSEKARAEADARVTRDRLLVDRIVRCVAAVDRAVETGPRRWSAHADRLRGLLKIVPGDAESDGSSRAVDALSGLLAEMTRLETLVGDTGDVTFERMRAWLEQAVDRTQLELHTRDAGGIRVLDAMQMRGLTFRRVYLLGMNAGLFPRSPREDPVLDDDARRAITLRSGRPLGRKLEAVHEERLLLAILLGSASDAVRVSWQRADRSGKAQTPSLALRELARLCYGRPDLERLNEAARHLRSHPAQEIEDLREDPGLLSARDEMLLSALSCSRISQADALGERFDALLPGLTMLRATESWDLAGSEYDARIDADASEPSLSVSALETLGNCPLKFFFQRVLRVEELPDEPSAVSIPSRELGSAVHDQLEQVYTRLRDEELFEEERSVDLVERGLQLLEENRADLLGETGKRAARRLPVLWHETERSWLRVVKLMVQADLQRAAGLKWKLLGVEEQRRETLELGQGVSLQLSARFDRRFEGEDGVTVGDYKTSKKLKDRVNATQMLQGLQLQVPLYHELAGPGSVVELLGMHPEFKEQETRAVFEGFAGDEQTESFRDTLRVLLGLRSAGVYPFHAAYHCKWCPFTSACRRHHPPTVDRESRSTDGKAYRELKRKQNKKPYG